MQSTALVSRAGLAGFHAGFVLIAVVAGLGVLTAAVAFQRRDALADEHMPVFEVIDRVGAGTPVFEEVGQVS